MDESTCKFHLVAKQSSQWFLYEPTSATGADRSGWCAYLLPYMSGMSSPPDDLPLENALGCAKRGNYWGSFLFALEAPADVPKFAATAASYIKSNYTEPDHHRAFLWFPNASIESGVASPALGFGFSAPAPEKLQIYAGGSVKLADGLVLRIGQSLKQFGPQLGVDGDAIVASWVNNSGKVPLWFADPNGAVLTALPTGSTARIPVLGSYAGCFLVAGSFVWEDLCSAFPQGVRYVHGTGTEGKDDAQIYPIIDPNGEASHGFVAAVDPLDPFNRSKTTVSVEDGCLRTVFGLSAPAKNGLGVRSFLRTTMNRPVYLLPEPKGSTLEGGPADNCGAVILEREGAEATPIAKDESAYFTLAGDFALQLEGSPPTAKTNEELLCGLFGTESIRLAREAGASSFGAVHFQPQCDAYVPVFPLPPSDLNHPDQDATKPLLTEAYRTSWASIANVGGDSGRYQVQTQGNALYTLPKDKAQDGSAAVLEVYEPWKPLPVEPLPLAPYAGLRGEAHGDEGDRGLLLSAFESQILSAERKRLIVEKTTEALRAATLAKRSAGVVADETDAATPKGLIVSVSDTEAGTVYDQVVLAQFRDDAGLDEQMAFYLPDAELQQLLQTNQLFGVAVNPKHLGDQDVEVPLAASFANRVNIAGWKMRAEVGEGVTPTDYRNVLILKFCDGKLVDRVKNPRKWTQAADFSVSEGASEIGFALTGLSKWLQGFFDRALAEADGGNVLYKNFARMARDASWQGILVLRAHADPTGIPDQIRGLAAGIDASQFEAHHFGATVSRVKVDKEEKTITIDGLSSLFGLIDYQYPAFRQNVASGGNPDIPLGIPIDGDYGFTVLQLQALFENAALVDFVSRVQLTANNLFGSKVVRTVDSSGVLPANGVVLRGAYEHHGSESTYVFKQVHRTSFEVDTNAFNAIAFDKVLFNTLSPGSAAKPIRSRFLIWGAFDFATLKVSNAEDAASEKPIDILSFGSPDEDALGEGLAYSSLQIDLSSPLAAPTAITFSFDSSRLSLDFGASKFRTESLFSEFALQVESFISSDGDKRPSGYGYLPVRVTDYPSASGNGEDPQGLPLKQQALSGPWFGIVYKVTMGTPGALVSKAGFESKMLIAWTPEVSDDPLTYPIFIGLKLPGAAPGAKLISLQGILKVSLDAIELTQQEREDKTRAFCLKLANIGLKFLGFLKLPPGATINFFLFGDPTGKGSLGWYAVYKKDQASNEELIALDDTESAEAIPAGVGSEEAAP